MPRISTFHIHLWVTICLATAVRADWWDDFSNNLATDLSPLLALFGEQVTKQFLSESVSTLDNFIFAMAPLGIVTAVVSAIRVCGGPSLRAFIGRAQEGGGIAEAELCSSTSRDVCELYHDGVIVRVFGRPKILEVVHDREATDFYHRLDEQNRLVPPKCGIYSFQDYVKTESAKKAGWKEIGVSDQNDIEQSKTRTGEDNKFAPNPNLSFNIGIRKHPLYVYHAAAVTGILTQASVIIFGGLATYHWQWKKNDAIPQVWAFPMMAAGTIILSLGMFFCAFLVERSTKERIFRKDPADQRNVSTTVYIAQPGNQNIGDQTYDSFAFADSSEPLKEYTTSWKVSTSSDEQKRVWLATGSTMLGFIFQFIGMRAMHSSVSVVLLAAILIMSIVRSALRTGRLRKEQNFLYNFPDMVEGHELDWLALRMDQSETSKDHNTHIISWSVVSGSLIGPGTILEPESPTKTYDIDNTSPNHQDTDAKPHKVEVFEIEENGNSLISVFKSADARFSPSLTNSVAVAEARWLSEDDTTPASPKGFHIAEKLMCYRSRLAELTRHQSKSRLKSSAEWDDRLVPLRQHAKQLKTAIESSIQILFAHSTIKPTWSEARSLACTLSVAVSKLSGQSKTLSSGSHKSAQLHHTHLFLRRKHFESSASGSSVNQAIWEVDQNSLEAVLGLWTWSIVSDPSTECFDEQGHTVSAASEVPKARVIAAGTSKDDIESAEMDFKYWTKDLPDVLSTKTWESIPQGHCLGANTLWCTQDGQGSLSEQKSSGAPTERLLRIFGWPGAMLLANRSVSDSSSKTFALVANVKQSIPVLCAQDVYQSCIGAVSTLIDSVGGKTTPVEDSGSFHLTNDIVSSLVKSVQDSGLGSSKDAYAMVIPALSRHLKLPLPTAALPEVYDAATKRRLAGDFNKSEAMLKWAWKISLRAQEQHQQNSCLETTILELAELYRNAYRRDFLSQDTHKPIQDSAQRRERDFGRKGIDWLQEIRGQESSTVVSEIIDRYVDLRNDWNHQKSREVASAVKVLKSLKEGDRTRCLIEITRVRDVAFLDESNRSILSWAAERGWLEIVTACLEIGTAVDSEDRLNRTPLSYAAQNGHTAVVHALMRHQALPNTKDEAWRTPLSYAAERGHTQVMGMLLDRRTDTETKDKEGQLPLHWAAKCGQVEAIELLCQRNAKLNGTNRRGETPFMSALDLHQEGAAQMLLRMGAALDFNGSFQDGVPHWCWCALSNGMWSTAGMLLELLNQDLIAKVSSTSKKVVAVMSFYPRSAIQAVRIPPSFSLQSTSQITFREIFQNSTQTAVTMATLSRAAEGLLDSTLSIFEYENEVMVGSQGIQLDLDQSWTTKRNETYNQFGGHGSERDKQFMGKLKLLLNHLRANDNVTKDLLIAAARNPTDVRPLELLLELVEDKIAITSEMTEATVIQETEISPTKLELLLNASNDVVITPSLVKAGEQNSFGTGRIAKVLLTWWPQDFVVPPGLLKALVEKHAGCENLHVLKQLVEQRPQDIIVTAEVLQAAYGNITSLAAKMVEPLLCSRPQEVLMTEEVFLNIKR